MILLLPWKLCRWHSTHIKLLNAINLQLNADAFPEKSFTMGLFSWSYANLFYGSGFFETQCMWYKSTHTCSHPTLSQMYLWSVTSGDCGIQLMTVHFLLRATPRPMMLPIATAAAPPTTAMPISPSCHTQAHIEMEISPPLMTWQIYIYYHHHHHQHHHYLTMKDIRSTIIKYKCKKNLFYNKV